MRQGGRQRFNADALSRETNSGRCTALKGNDRPFTWPSGAYITRAPTTSVLTPPCSAASPNSSSSSHPHIPCPSRGPSSWQAAAAPDHGMFGKILAPATSTYPHTANAGRAKAADRARDRVGIGRAGPRRGAEGSGTTLWRAPCEDRVRQPRPRAFPPLEG